MDDDDKKKMLQDIYPFDCQILGDVRLDHLISGGRFVTSEGGRDMNVFEVISLFAAAITFSDVAYRTISESISRSKKNNEFLSRDDLEKKLKQTEKFKLLSQKDPRRAEKVLEYTLNKFFQDEKTER